MRFSRFTRLLLLVTLVEHTASQRTPSHPTVQLALESLVDIFSASPLLRHVGGEGVAGEVDAAGKKTGTGAVEGGAPGDFNLYIFAMSWKPEWCYRGHHAGCQAPRPFWRTHLTIHGLWPDYGDGTYPTQCTTEAYDHDRVVAAVGLDELETVWPNVEVPEDAGRKYDSFWEHEWSKHGTCSGLSQEAYFSATVELLKVHETPSELMDNVGGQVARAALEEAYGGEGMVILDCVSKRYLSQVLLCFELDPSTYLPAKQVPCPAAVVAHDDSCQDGTLSIASF